MPLLLKIFLVIIGLIAALILAGFVWLRVNQEKILNNMLDSVSQFEDHIGEDVPDFELETPDGVKITPDTLLEDKELAAIVLYASWCGPCEKEFPEMDVYMNCHRLFLLNHLSLFSFPSKVLLLEYFYI